MRLRFMLLVCALVLATPGWAGTPGHEAVRHAAGQPGADRDPKTVATGLVELEILDCRGPRAARVAITDAKGQPVGGLPGLGWIWVNGVFRARMPEGLVNLRISSGPRLASWQGVLRVRADRPLVEHKMLGSLTPGVPEGWWACDPYVATDAGQADGASYSFYSLADAITAAQAEGVQVLGVAGGWNLHAQRGRFLDLPEGGALLHSALQREQGDNFIGISSWSCERPGLGRVYALEPRPVRPEDQVAAGEYLFETAARIHDRGGLAILAHPCGRESAGAIPVRQSQAAAELIFDAVTGMPWDAVDVSQGGEDLRLWQALLNEGHSCTAIGGGPGLKSPQPLDIPTVGCYVQIAPDEMTGAAVLAAVKRGAVVVSNGPFVRFWVDGVGPGGVVPPGTAMRTIQVEALSSGDGQDSIRRVELIYNGHVIRTIRGNRLQRTLCVQVQETLADVGWLAARYVSYQEERWALCNPVYIKAPELMPMAPTAARVTVQVRDAGTGTGLQGEMEVWNLGVCLQRLPVGPGPVTLEIPATARFEFRVDGYLPAERTVYRDGGPAAFMAALAAKGSLGEALTSWRTFERMRELLRDVRLEVNMQPLPAMAQAASP